MDARARALDRYRKLLLLAVDQDGTPEGSTAARLAAEIAARWHLDPAEMAGATGDAFGRGPPTLRVDLGGRLDNRHRERFRPALLGFLASLAGLTQATFDPRSWTGALYGDPLVCRRVERVYDVVSAALDREYDRHWIPQRFGARRVRAEEAMVWWTGALDGLAEAVRASPAAVEGSMVLARVITEQFNGSGWWETPEWVKGTAGYKRGYRAARHRLSVQTLAIVLDLKTGKG